MSDTLKLSGKKFSVPVTSTHDWKFIPRPGGWMIAERLTDHGVLERRRFLVTERRGRWSLHLDGKTYQGEWQTQSFGKGGSASSADDLKAQFPGKVRKLLVAEGDQVSEGAPLIMVEAMKMEFPVKAPFAGKVTKIHVSEGQQLSPGDLFLDLEESV